MKHIWFEIAFFAFLLAPSVSVASMMTNYEVGGTGTVAAIHILNAGCSSDLQLAVRTTATLLIASAQGSPQNSPQNEGQANGKHKGKDKGKGEFHGAEMSTTAVVIAGVFAISAYLFLVRRNSRRRA